MPATGGAGMGVRGSFGMLLCCFVALAGCGGDDDSAASDDDVTTTSNEVTTSTIAAVPTLDGLYFLTGTQTCKSALGPGTTSFPLFAGSTLAISGDRAWAGLRSDPPEASVTTDGASFHVNVTYSGRTNAAVTTVAGASPSALDLVLDLSGTISDDGQTITGTGFDTGVNCEYEFTGSRSAIGDTGAGTEKCGGEAALVKVVAETPREDGLTFTADDVIVEAMTPDGQIARYLIGQAAEGFAGCEPDGWKLADPDIVRLALCESELGKEIAPQLDVDCGPSTTAPSAAPTTTPVVTAPANPVSGSCDAQGALDATIAKHPDTIARDLDTVLACEDGWAVVVWSTGDADLMEVLQLRDGAWVATPGAACTGAAGIPESVRFYACMTG
ncbi:MAG TPA: hypothetical protein VFX21_07430 [Acidimicrobiia bacterium]|nr:hypothetical protein [Acidimicrobiia bacterium]